VTSTGHFLPDAEKAMAAHTVGTRPLAEANNASRASARPQPPQPQAALQAPAQAPEQARRGTQDTVASVNRLPGLASGINSEQIINKLMAVERKRLEPIQEQKASTQKELQAFGIVNESLHKINATIEQLKSSGVWDGKLIESSDEKVVTATATAGAKPGKYTLVVDRLALNHQIASQGYDTPETQIGTGKLLITVGEGAPVTVVIDNTNNTLSGLKDAINFATKDVQATIIKTGSRTQPYQLVLTSQKTGMEGKITPDVKLTGGTTPNFQNSVDEPSAWKGVGEAAGPERPAPLKGQGASTAIAQVIGEYAGKEDATFTFTAVQTGDVGGQKQLQLRWKDDHGRSGSLNLDALHYAPGQPIELTDGLALVFSEGEIIVNDSFSFQAHAERSNLVWWVSPQDRKAHVDPPTSWQRQRSEAFGAPVIEGTYDGTAQQKFTLTVQGSGQVGRSDNLNVEWQGEAGEHGTLNVGNGYEPGTPLALTNGLTLTLKPGVLASAQTATFEAIPQRSTGRWWLSEEERKVPSAVESVTNWTTPGAEEAAAAGVMPALPEGAGPRVSTSKVKIGGQFTGQESKVYTFTAKRDGAVGTTKDLKVTWDDSKGNAGELSIGENYQPGSPLKLAEGLVIAFGPGRIFKDDTFTMRTRTSTIQPAQDAKIRFGATELGGGLEVTSPKNEMDGVIEGVHLELVSTSDKPVTISVRGDTQQAQDSVTTFVNQYNELAAVIAELTKFDKDNNIAGPLLGNRDLANIQDALSRLLMDPVVGLPKTSNMIMALGVTYTDKGMLQLDESTLQNKIQQDFASVANLFRDKGESDNSNVAFVGMGDDTHVNTEGYPVDIQHPATQGYYETTPLNGPIILTPQNNRFFVNVDGRQSGQLTLQPGQYSLASYARALQNAILKDEAVGQRKVRVMIGGDQLRVVSDRFGKDSSINFVPASDSGQVGPGLMQGLSEPGADVQGTIDGKTAEGRGQLLMLPAKSGPASGLRVYVKLAESQIDPSKPEATVKITRGIAGRVGKYLGTIVNPLNGEMKRITQGLRERVGSLDAQLKRMEERITAKRERLQERYTRLESQMASLKQQQAYMQSQMAGMGGGGIPGLPGMPSG
jgi:flagellar capping protein FliD